MALTSLNPAHHMKVSWSLSTRHSCFASVTLMLYSKFSFLVIILSIHLVSSIFILNVIFSPCVITSTFISPQPLVLFLSHVFQRFIKSHIPSSQLTPFSMCEAKQNSEEEWCCTFYVHLGMKWSQLWLKHRHCTQRPAKHHGQQFGYSDRCQGLISGCSSHYDNSQIRYAPSHNFAQRPVHLNNGRDGAELTCPVVNTLTACYWQGWEYMLYTCIIYTYII